jgi:hypothetical protein
MKNVRKKIGLLLMAAVIFLGGLLGPVPQNSEKVQASEYSIPSSAKEYGGHYYKLYNEKGIGWSRAEEKCEALGGHLVVITSVQEEAFVEGLTDSHNCWIGVYEDSESNLKWINGETFSYYPRESYFRYSDIYWQYSYYLEGASGTWKSDSLDYMSYYICEWDTSTETVLPAQVKFTSLKKASSTQAILSWKKVSGAKGYAIYMKTGKKGTYKKIDTVKGASTTTYIAAGLESGKTYYFRIRAYKKIYGERSYGELSVEKKIKMK